MNSIATSFSEFCFGCVLNWLMKSPCNFFCEIYLWFFFWWNYFVNSVVKLHCDFVNEILLWILFWNLCANYFLKSGCKSCNEITLWTFLENLFVNSFVKFSVNSLMKPFFDFIGEMFLWILSRNLVCHLWYGKTATNAPWKFDEKDIFRFRLCVCASVSF